MALEMEYIDTMENYIKEDDVRLFDTLLTDYIFDQEDYTAVSDSVSCRWLDEASAAKCYGGLVNDCMMLSGSVAADLKPHVQSEHSYSIAGSGTSCTEIKLEPDTEFEFEAMNAINPNLALNGSVADLHDIPSVSAEEVKSEFLHSDETCYSEDQSIDSMNCEEIEMPAEISTVPTQKSPTFVVTCTTQLMRRQPTIIVTNSRQSIPFNSTTFARTFANKSETDCLTSSICGNSSTNDRSKDERGPVYILTSNCQRSCDDTRLPLTPPASSTSCSSSSSDSECSQSPKRQAPSSPQTIQRIYQHQSGNSLLTVQQRHSPSIAGTLPSSGMFILTEEEKRTMIAEGYPVPTRLPLSKQEEKNLKKVQRKIKNKMSAQESRRKKKDYVESLEKKLEVSNQENNQLKKQLDHLASDNKSLLSQLHKLQILANNLSPLQSSTCLAVFILFFAVGFGIWSPTGPTSVVSPSNMHMINSEDTLLHTNLANDYLTPNMRSRTLKTYEDDVDIGDSLSSVVHRHSLLDWLLGFCRPYQSMSAEVLVANDTAIEKGVVINGDTVAVIELKPANSTWTDSNTQLS